MAGSADGGEVGKLLIPHLPYPGRSSQGRREKRRRSFDGGPNEECNRVERLVGHLKQFQRIATRYEKSAESYLPMLTLAAILLWL